MATMEMQGARLFVGRHDEMSTVSALIDSVRGGRGQALVIEGEAGIGKSRFVDEVMALVSSSGFEVHRDTAKELERDVPFGPLQSIAADQTIEGILDAFEQAAQKGPTVIVVEDLHWADVSTLQLLARALRVLPLLPLFLISSARPYPRPRELQAFVEEVRASGTVLPLSPLEHDEVKLLATELLDGRPGPNLLEELQGAGGNPLFVTQLIGAIRDEGSVRPVGDALDIAHSEVPPSMRVTILRRMSYLSAPTIETLKVAAILGTSFDLTVLSKLIGRSASDTYAHLNEALKAQLLVERGDELAFRHDLVRDALYEDLPATVRKALHADVAKMLSAIGHPSTVVAGHISRSAIKGDAEAVSVLRDAAREIVRTAPSEAADLLEHALGIATPELPNIDLVAVEYADALFAAGRLKDAEIQARAVIASGAASSGRARAILVRSLRYRGQLDESLEELVEAAESASNDHDKAGLWAEVARSLAQAGEVERAHDAARRAIDIAERVGDDPALALAMAADAATWQVGGRDATIELLDRAVKIAGDDLREAWRADVIILASMMLGDPRERRPGTIELLQRGLRDAEEAGLTWSLPDYHAIIGVLHHREGDFDDARAEMEIARELGNALGTWYLDGYLAARLARLAVARGDLEEARALIEEGERLRPVADYRHENAAQFAYARCLLAQAENGPDEVLAIIKRSSDEFSSKSGWAGYLLFFIDFVPLMLAAGWRSDVEQMHATLSEILPGEGDSSVALLLRLRALLDDDPELAVTAVDLALANDDYPPETALLLEDAAGVLSRHGRKDEATGYLQIALERWEAFGAPRFAARVEARLRDLGVRRGVRGRRGRPSTGWDALTGTEQKVVALVGHGLLYRDIAERLFVSRRTVETHVAHIFEKLGVSSRRELGDLMTDRPAETTVQ